MFIALDCNKNRVSIENVIPGEEYFCPVCGKKLMIRASDSLAVRTHFAHKRGTHCYDDWHHDMSEWHLEWQKKFPEQYREVIIEKDGIKHRADICINNTIIEFQHSPITGEEIAKRNNFYLGCGYQVVWVFDATGQIKNFFEDSIDPMQCRDDDLCWKRAKSQFSIEILPQVIVYLQYKTHISNSKFLNQDFDIMLWLTKISSKEFTFFKTYPFYIQPINFLKEYGVVSDENILSIGDIIAETNLRLEQEKERQRVEKNRRINEWLNALYARPKRNWHL